VQALNAVGIEVPESQFFTMLGPSGCGKTTLLRCIAGLERPDAGQIEIGGRIVYSSSHGRFIPPSERNVGMVFQSYAIWPHMTVAGNVGFPLRHGKRRYSKGEIERKVSNVLEIVQLQGLEDRPAPLLSGGQQQRVALARALVMEPAVLLLDEPLSNLDAKIREEVRAEIRLIQKRLKITVIYVTHDQSEALTMSDVIAVMNRGSIVEIGEPRTLYEDPRHIFTAQFIGTTNTVPGRVVSHEDGLCTIEARQGMLYSHLAGSVPPKTEVVVTIRPEDVRMAKTSEHGSWEGRVVQSIFLGNQMEYRIDAGGLTLRVECDAEQDYRDGETVFLNFDPGRCLTLLE
jgi:iron(III) transport system ATP-binding protein